ncbi:MAG TPA: hypothetical protein PKW33_14500 [Anaerolineaceae bacterium]|nr:hypothetical protein [Anaerolineaceae bacterium]HPN52800.1 hypothetical protein [Anaerolineaceae bacterium]
MSSSVLHQVLASERGRFNQKFLEARHTHPELKGAAFKAVLEEVLTPLMAALEAADRAAAAQVVEPLYDLTLELTCRSLLGPDPRYPAVMRGWQSLLPELGRFILTDPRRLAGAITNALYNLAQVEGTRPDDWMMRLRAAAPYCASPDELLRAGQVMAWQAGMAHYRSSALKACEQLQPGLARSLLVLPQHVDLKAALLRLRNDPWWDPAAPPLPAPALKMERRVGAFRGFGGEFLTPPRVVAGDGFFQVQEREEKWALFADIYGAVLRRLPPAEAAPAHPAAAQAGPVLKNGVITWQNQSLPLPELNAASSWAASEHTLVAASPLSHALWVVAVKR